MDLWRIESDERPKVVSGRNLLLALALHVGAFLLFFLYAVIHGLFNREEKIIPIDLTVVVNENLDGVENEPPPLKNPTPPEPEPPKPKPKPKPEPKKLEPPKPLEQIVTNVVEKKEAPKKKEEPKKEDPKKEEPKKPEPPKKTKAELRKEKIERMRNKAKVVNKKVTIEVKNAPASGNGRTQKQTMSREEILRKLNEGYRPGTSNQLATSEEQRCLSLIQMAINEMWDRLQPKIGNPGQVLLSVQFNSSGGMINVRLSRGCGDRLSDEAALSVARRITAIPGLSAEFISKYRSTPLTLRYNVRAR